MDMQEMSFQNVIDTVLNPAGVKVGGYPDDLFLELADDEREQWQCSICYLVSREAKQCDNGHLFCATCVFAWSMTYGANSDKCPVCRAKQATYSARSDVDDRVGRKRVRCPEPTCGFRAPLTYLLKHSHGAERFGDSGIDLESLRRSRPAPINPFAGGSGVIFLPLLRAPGGSPAAAREGRSLLQDMMMVLHLEMELRRRAIERFSSEEDHMERVRHMTEVLAIQEQMQEITGFLNLLFSISPQQHRSDGPVQDAPRNEQHLASQHEESENEVEDTDSSDSNEGLILTARFSRMRSSEREGTSGTGINTLSDDTSSDGIRPSRNATESAVPAVPQLPLRNPGFTPFPPRTPRTASVPRGRWRSDEGQETLGEASSQSVAVLNHTDAPPAQTIHPAAEASLQASLSRPTVPHTRRQPHSIVAPSASIGESRAEAGSAVLHSADVLVSTVPRRPSRMGMVDGSRSGESTTVALAASGGSSTFHSVMRQLPPIARPSVAASPSRFSDATPMPPDALSPLPSTRERSVFVPQAAALSEGSGSAATLVRATIATRRIIRRKKVAAGVGHSLDGHSRRDPEPPTGAPPTHSRSQMTPSSGSGTNVSGTSLQHGGRQHPARTRGIDISRRPRDNSSQRQ